jgi:FSR family fosmidomycin resistance protein-like MFS transporter
MVGGETGRTLGPVIVVTAVGILTLQRTYWLMVGGLVGSAMLYARLRDVPGKPPNAGKSLPWRQALRVMSPLLLPLAGIMFVRAFLLVSLTTYLPILLREGGANLWLAGASLTVLEAAGVVGALLGGSLSDHLGRRAVLWASMLATPFLMFAFLGVQGWFHFLLLLLLGFSALSVTPVIMAVVQESYPENRALANGIYMALSFVLRSVVVLWVGMLGDRFGQRMAFAISAAVPLLGLPLLFWLPIQRRQAG